MVSPKRPLDKNVMADQAFAVKLLVYQGHFRNAEAKKSKGAAKKKVWVTYIVDFILCMPKTNSSNSSLFTRKQCAQLRSLIL